MTGSDDDTPAASGPPLGPRVDLSHCQKTFPESQINCKYFSYMGTLTIDDVFQSVILATLKSSDNHALHTAYDQIL
jgi:hypothetical protein